MKKKYILIGGGVILLICLFILFSWHPKIHGTQNSYHRINTQEKEIILTFDDGPGEETEKILDILAEKNVSATFFVVGERVAWYPQVTERILAEGHEIGTQGYEHRFALFKGVHDLHKGSAVQIGNNTQITYYRPPYGFRTIHTYYAARKLQMKTILWDVMPLDFYDWNAKRISEYVLNNIRKGSIIVLHDGPEGQEETVIALPLIIEGARKQGYKFTNLSTGLKTNE